MVMRGLWGRCCALLDAGGDGCGGGAGPAWRMTGLSVSGFWFRVSTASSVSGFETGNIVGWQMQAHIWRRYVDSVGCLVWVR